MGLSRFSSSSITTSSSSSSSSDARFIFSRAAAPLPCCSCCCCCSPDLRRFTSVRNSSSPKTASSSLSSSSSTRQSCCLSRLKPMSCSNFPHHQHIVRGLAPYYCIQYSYLPGTRMLLLLLRVMIMMMMIGRRYLCLFGGSDFWSDFHDPRYEIIGEVDHGSRILRTRCRIW